MAFNASASLVQEGLRLFLDAGNLRSYPGSGTTWYDLSGNGNHCTANGFVSNPVFQNTKGGRFYFNGATSKSYFQSSSVTNLSNIGNHTVLVWLEWVPASHSRYYAFDSRVSTPATGTGIGFDKETSTTASPFNFVNDTSGYDECSGPTNFQQNTVYQHGIIRNGSSIQIIDTNSTSLISPSLASNTLGNSLIGALGNYRVGAYEGCVSGTAEYWWSGYIYAVMLYNRVLTSTEITQNHRVFSTRLGI